LIGNGTEGGRRLPPVCDKQIFQDFVTHIETDAPALLDAQDTFDVTEACLLARQSADEGRIVKF
jgi:hypothetical protein